MTTSEVRRLAARLGFDLVGVTSAAPFAQDEHVALQRLRDGLMDGLPWYTESRVRRGCHPQRHMPAARSVIALAVNYYTAGPAHGLSKGASHTTPLVGRVSRYAWGEDYHRIIRAKLKRFAEGLRALGASQTYVSVDTGPMLDRAVAARAGVGWSGKNANLLTPRFGSWVFLAEVVTDLGLPEDKPLSKSCGRCTACIPACPTGAIVAPHVVDNRRCISYLTIECRGPIPRGLRSLMGDWVFGCDICQDVCPVNLRHATESAEPAFRPRDAMRYRPDLLRVLSMGEDDFQRVYSGSPIKRAKLTGLKRNVCVALGNIGDRRAVPALARALREESPLVRGHAAWALGRIGGEQASQALDDALSAETDESVREEIQAAREGLGTTSTRAN
ncbi:MAG: tRNA epoxyqueuosine(34) reductase QueG [Chloroflexi bacterium]|nr:tRNA epoxyqueuosine(34) reductase QueG [Chloroflexota bacterium]